jgi:ESCRT-I complex subunit TSG101
MVCPVCSTFKRKPKGCNLSGLLEAMQDQFSNEPPVYSKPKSVVPVNSRSPQRTNHGKPPPPVPSIQTSQTPAAIAVSSSANTDRPTLPPKPGPTGLGVVAQASEPIHVITHSSPPFIQNVRRYVHRSLYVLNLVSSACLGAAAALTSSI